MSVVPTTAKQYTKIKVNGFRNCWLAIHPTQEKWVHEWLQKVKTSTLQEFGPCPINFIPRHHHPVFEVSDKNINQIFPYPCDNYETQLLDLMGRSWGEESKSADDKSIATETSGASVAGPEKDLVPTVRFQVHEHGVAPRQSMDRQDVFFLSLPDNFVPPLHTKSLTRCEIDLCVTAQCPPGSRLVLRSRFNANDGQEQQLIITSAKDQRLHIIVTKFPMHTGYCAGQCGAELTMEKLEFDYRIAYDKK